MRMSSEPAPAIRFRMLAKVVGRGFGPRSSSPRRLSSWFIIRRKGNLPKSLRANHRTPRKTPEDTRLARSLPEGKIADPAVARDARQFDDKFLYAKDRKSRVPTDGERQFRKRVEDQAAESKLAESLNTAGDGSHRRAGATDAARSEKPGMAQQTPASQETLRDIASGRGVLDSRSEKTNGAVAGGGLSTSRNFGFRSDAEQTADAPTNQPAEGRPAGKPESTAAPFDRLATNEGAAPVQFGDKLDGQGKGGPLGRGPVVTARSSSREPSPSGEMFVAEIATEPGVSPEAFQRLLDKHDISLDSSPAANLALISAVQSASRGNASNASTLNGIADGGSSPAERASLGAAGFGSASRGGASGNGSAAKIAAGTFSAPPRTRIATTPAFRKPPVRHQTARQAVQTPRWDRIRWDWRRGRRARLMLRMRRRPTTSRSKSSMSWELANK